MKKKTLIISIVAVLVLAVGGILAYLTDTASVTNTFTVGNVDITLDEAKVDTEGKPLDANGQVVENVNDVVRVTEGNEYHLVPGLTYVKDPTMTVKEGSEESYVRMVVTINCLSQFDEIFDPYPGSAVVDIFNGYDANNWILAGETRDADANTITYEFRYKEAVTAEDEDVVLDALFDSITIPGFITKEQLAAIADLEIVVEGHAIQAAGFENTNENGVVVKAIDNAWAAFEGQMKK